MTYFAHCFIGLENAGSIKKQREKHLTYVKESGSCITYGGVCGTANAPYQSICFFLNVGSKNEAEKFVQGDPYYSSYSTVEIREFEQKIPKIGQ